MKISIAPQENSSVTEELEIELGNYTILAGENNSGKTNLIKAIISKVGEKNVIYIPAEVIDAEESVKTSAASDPMRDAISKLLNIAINEMPQIDGNFKQLFDDIIKTFNSFEVSNTELKLEPKEFNKSALEKILKDALAAKILNSVIVDKHGSEKEIGINSVGQGIQRLIIASIIQEIGKVRVNREEILILFEEPEIYLHPKLKEKLYSSLVNLSEQPNVKVIITTHDPYFIELGRSHKIYNIFRDESASGATKHKPIDHTVDGYLGYRSHSEINYLIFGLVSDTYFLELYEKLKSSFIGGKDCKECGRPTPSQYNVMNQWLKDNSAAMLTASETRLGKLRHAIGHRTESTEEYIVKEDDIKEAIKFIKLKQLESS